MKKILCSIFSFVILISLFTACSGTSSGTADTTDASSSEEASHEEASSEEVSSEEVSSEPIKLGYYGPLTGNTADGGQAALKGVQLAVDQLNENGGILSREVQLVYYDDKSNPEDAVKAATKLVQVDKVNAVVGSLLSSNVLATGPIFEEYQTICVGSGTSPTWLQQGYTYMFRALSNSSISTAQMAKFAHERGFSNVAMLISNSDYGNSGKEGFMSACEEDSYDINIVADESYTDGDRDFTGQFAKINAANPDVVYVWGLGDDLGAITKQLRQAGYNGPIIGPEGYSRTDVREMAGDAANEVYFPAQYLVYENPEDAEDENMRAFLEAFVEAYGATPDNDTTYRAYDATMLIAYAIESSGAESGSALRDAFNDIDGYIGLAGTFSYKGGVGEGISTMRVFTIVDGEVEEAD